MVIHMGGVLLTGENVKIKMKNIIRKILKEEVSDKQEQYHKKLIDILTREGFVGTSPYQDILKYLNQQLGIEGMDAFEVYQLFKDNWRTPNTPLERKDITKRKMKTANIRGRDLVLNKIPFKGSNTHGEYKNGVYVVFSYDWYPIFVFKDGQWFENENRYSVSTGKQMSQLRPYGQGDILTTSKDKLWDIINR